MTAKHRGLEVVCVLALSGAAVLACSSESPSQGEPRASAGESTGGAGGSTTSGGGSGGGGGTVSQPSGGKATGGSAGSQTGSGDYLTPAPLVCRDREVESSPDGGEVAFDGEWDFDSTWRTPADGWVKIKVGDGPSRLLFVWHTDSTPDYTIVPEINFGAPTGYRIEVSATSEEGSWTSVAEVTGEPDDISYRSAAHSFDFAGMSYVRFTVTKIVSTQGKLDAQIGEIEIHDISASAEDSWAVVGFGQSRSTYHGKLGMFPELVHEAHPAYYPALIDLAEIGGEARNLVNDIDDYLARNPDFHFWILAYGMGDAQNNRTPQETDFKASMQAVIDKLVAAGKVPLIPRLEKVTNDNHTTVAQFNAVIDELVEENDLLPAPDLYSLFSEQPELLCSECEGGREGLDFSPEGETAVNELWAEAIDHLYAP